MSSFHTFWKIEYTNFFEKALKECLKVNYKKDKKGKRMFLEEVDRIVAIIKENPFFGDLEPFPDIKVPEGFELRKVYFHAPRLRGASAEARLIYMVVKGKRTLILVHIYTHKQYEDRPDLDLLEYLIKEYSK